MEKGINLNAVKPEPAAEAQPLVKQVQFEGKGYVLRAGKWEDISGGRTIAVCFENGCQSVGELHGSHAAEPFRCLDQR